MTREQTPIVSYEESETRALASKAWENGEDMDSFVKERYQRIVRSRYKTKHGLCFVSAGSILIGGSSPYNWIANGPASGVTSFLICVAFAVLFILFAHFAITKDMKDDMRKIEEGKFLWKSDTVYGRAPDKFPKKSRIWLSSERDSVVTLQAFFWFNKGDTCYVVKDTEDSKDLQAFIL